MTDPLTAYARAHRVQSHQNKTKIMFLNEVDWNWIIAFKEGRLSQPPPTDSRRRRGAGAGPSRRVPVEVPVVQEPEFKFEKKVGWSGGGCCWNGRRCKGCAAVVADERGCTGSERLRLRHAPPRKPHPASPSPALPCRC